MTSFLAYLLGKIKKYSTIIVSCLVVLFITLGFLRERESLWIFPWAINPKEILLSLVVYAGLLFLMFLNWHSLIGLFKAKNNFEENAIAFFVSAIAKRVPTPIPFLGQRVRSYKTQEISPTYIIVATIIETILLFIGGSLYVFFVTAFLNFSLLKKDWLIILAFPSLLIFIFPNLIIRLVNLGLKFIHQQTLTVSIGRSKVIIWIGLTITAFYLNTLSMHFLMTGVSDIPLTIQETYLASSVFYLLTYLTLILTGGLGIKETVFGVMMRPLIPFSVGIIFTLLVRLAMTIVEFLLFSVIKIITSSIVKTR